MYRVTVEGDSVPTLKTALAAMLASLSGEAAEPAAVAGKKGPGRPAKSAGPSAADMAAEMGLDVPAEKAPAAPPAPKQKTEAEVKAALMECMALRTGDADELAGNARVKAVLGQFGAQKISELKPAQYNDVVAAAQKA